MDPPPSRQPTPGRQQYPPPLRARDSWEDWKDEDMYTPIEDNVQLVPHVPETQSISDKLPQAAQIILARQNSKATISGISRLKSSKRQKYQNEIAGIKVITDMAALKYAQSQQNAGSSSQDGRRFVDAAALKAIANSSAQEEKSQQKQQRQQLQKHQGSSSTQFSDDDRVIIGIAMSPGTLGDREISPQTSVIETPLIDFGPSTNVPAVPQVQPATRPYNPSQQPATTYLSPSQQKSVWSPDTPDTLTPFEQTPVSITFSPAPPHNMTSPQSASSATWSLQIGQSTNPFFQSPSDAVSCYPVSIFDRYDSDGVDSPQTPFDDPRRQRTSSTVGASKMAQISFGETKTSTTNKEMVNSPLSQVQSHTPIDERNDAIYWLNRLTESPVPPQMSVPAAFPAPVQTSKVATLPVVPLIQSQPVYQVSAETRNQFNFTDSTGNDSDFMQTHDTNTPASSTTNNTDNWWEEQNVYEKQERQPQVFYQERFFVTAQSATIHGSSPNFTISSAQTTPRFHPFPGLSLASATMASNDRPIAGITINNNKLEQRAPTSTVDATDVSTTQKKTTEKAPPPYSPARLQSNIPYRAMFPPNHHMASRELPPSPGPISPGFAGSMSRGGVHMDEIPLTPAVNGPLVAGGHGTFYHYHTHIDPYEYRKIAEKKRKRWEKEEKVANKAGGLWKGRGCIPKRGCAGRGGAEGRKRRRFWLMFVMIILMAITAAIIAGVMVRRRKYHLEEQSIWVNITGFPPMPMGLLTVVAPDNTDSFDGCTEPSALWSCDIPKELQSNISPFDASSPTVTLNIQYDNGTDNSWKIAWESSTVLRRATPSFSPEPAPPSVSEMAFLGNYTDDVQSNQKEGEPTPFYISMLDMIDNATIPGTSENAGTVVTQPRNITLPIPQTKNDGTAVNARLFPRLWQQPVRLFDRGLPTEHYGFYQYFRRTIYVTNINSTITSGTMDENGGAPITDSDYLVTWAQTRVKVALWTNMGNSSALLSASTNATSSGKKRPGTMPYPATINLDTHGGDPDEKVVWAWEMSNSKVDTRETYFIANEISVGGVVVNPRGTNANDSLGGFDGGVGGCKCEWQNYLARSRGS